MPIPFIGKRYTAEAFQEYLKTVAFNGTFKPKFVTLHHTGVPSLGQRPTGLSDTHLQNILSGYKAKGWSGAPHLFVDDREDGIIVFQRLDIKGVHAASFNTNSIGIEMLGNFNVEDPNGPRGKKVIDLSLKATAMLCQKLGAKAESIKFHRDDHLTNKTCPGTKISKQDVIDRLAKLMQSEAPDDMVDTEEEVTWTLILPSGATYPSVETHQGRPIAHVRKLLDALSPGGTFKLKADRTEVAWTPAGGVAKPISVAELDDDGKAWAFVRDLVTAAGRPLGVNGRTLTIS